MPALFYICKDEGKWDLFFFDPRVEDVMPWPDCTGILTEKFPYCYICLYLLHKCVLYNIPFVPHYKSHLVPFSLQSCLKCKAQGQRGYEYVSRQFDRYLATSSFFPLPGNDYFSHTRLHLCHISMILNMSHA